MNYTRLRRIYGAALVVGMALAIEPVHSAAAPASELYVVRYDHWSDEDERVYGQFIAAIGESDCDTIDACLHSAANPFRASDAPGIVFQADCADLPYLLRFYFSWKRGLPFSYESAVAPRGRSGDLRFTADGNVVTARADLPSGVLSGYAIIERLRDAVSSATYRIHPDLDGPLPPDHYSAALDAKTIRPGTIIYDPNGHLATVYRVDPNGRVHFFDAHPDYTLTRMFYDLRFARAPPGMGAGFKNWRPQILVGAKRRQDGALVGGHVELARNRDIASFSDVQFFGNGARPGDQDWASGTFKLNGERLDYYDYVRAELAGGQLLFDPVKEIHDMVDSNCSDLHYRLQAVDIALAAGVQNKPQPARLPLNIYGTDGDWETYSTPSRDARLKTAFKALRDTAQRFVEMYERGGDPHLSYLGEDLVGDLIATFDRQSAACNISYARSDGNVMTLSYEEARRRLFAMSFDPYQCVERRWGATEASELSTCKDDGQKRAWYAAEQNLRNQIDRTYEARMDFSLEELGSPGPGKGVTAPPDTDMHAYLLSVRGAAPGHTVAAAQPDSGDAP